MVHIYMEVDRSQHQGDSPTLFEKCASSLKSLILGQWRLTERLGQQLNIPTQGRYITGRYENIMYIGSCHLVTISAPHCWAAYETIMWSGNKDHLDHKVSVISWIMDTFLNTFFEIKSCSTHYSSCMKSQYIRPDRHYCYINCISTSSTSTDHSWISINHTEKNFHAPQLMMLEFGYLRNA